MFSYAGRVTRINTKQDFLNYFIAQINKEKKSLCDTRCEDTERNIKYFEYVIQTLESYHDLSCVVTEAMQVFELLFNNNQKRIKEEIDLIAAMIRCD